MSVHHHPPLLARREVHGILRLPSGNTSKGKITGHTLPAPCEGHASSCSRVTALCAPTDVTPCSWHRSAIARDTKPLIGRPERLEAKLRPEARGPGVVRVEPEHVAGKLQIELLTHILHALHEQATDALPLQRFAHTHIVQTPIAPGRRVPRLIARGDRKERIFRHRNHAPRVFHHQQDWRSGSEYVE